MSQQLHHTRFLSAGNRRRVGLYLRYYTHTEAACYPCNHCCYLGTGFRGAGCQIGRSSIPLDCRLHVFWYRKHDLPVFLVHQVSSWSVMMGWTTTATNCWTVTIQTAAIPLSVWTMILVHQLRIQVSWSATPRQTHPSVSTRR